MAISISILLGLAQGAGVAVVLTIALYLWIASRQVRPRKKADKSAKKTEEPGVDHHALLRRHSDPDLSLLFDESATEGQEKLLPRQEADLEHHPTSTGELTEEWRQWLRENLPKVKLISYINATFFEDMLGLITIKNLEDDEALFKEGESDGTIFIILSGSLEGEIHLKLAGHHDRLVWRMGKGEAFTSLLTVLACSVDAFSEKPKYKSKVTSSMSAKAIGKTYVAMIPPSVFKMMILKHPSDSMRLAQTILTRLQRVTLGTLAVFFGLRDHIRSESCAAPDLSPSDVQELLAAPDISSPTAKKRAAELILDWFGLPRTSELADTVFRNIEIKNMDAGEALQLPHSKLDMVFILQGEVATPKRVAQHLRSSYSSGQLVDPLNLFTGSTSSRGLVASEQTTIAKLPRGAFMSMSTDPRILLRVCSKILDSFSDLVYQLDLGMEWIHLKAGETLVEKGQRPHASFIVLSGRIRAVDKPGEPSITTKDFLRGEIVGALEMINDEAFDETFFAVRDSELAQVPKLVFDIIASRYPKVLLHFGRMVAQMSRIDPKNQGNTNGIATPQIATIAVIPATPTVQASVFAYQLLQCILQVSSAIHIDAKFARQKFGPIVHRRATRGKELLQELHLSNLLSEVEEAHRLVIFEAEYKDSEWSRLCVRQADAILILCEANKKPFLPKSVERLLIQAFGSRQPRIEVVSIHDSHNYQRYVSRDWGHLFTDPRVPTDPISEFYEQRRWLRGFHNVRAPFHDHLDDIGRLMRRITGTSIGLVLGGGGARGLAHIGVIRALEECGVPIDIVGGTSCGAFVGGLYAMYPDDYPTLVKKARNLSKKLGSTLEKLLDLTLPITSFFNGSRFNQGLIHTFGEVRIQDLLLNYFCVSTDIASSHLAVHRKGPLWKYVRASMSLQGYLPPITDNGSVLVDGGYLNNLPGDVMMGLGVRSVIAVDVGRQPLRDYYDYGTSLSGWWLLFNKLNPFSKTLRVPSMGDVSQTLVFVSAERQLIEVKKSVDLYLNPPIQDFDTLEFDKFDEIVAVGYEYAKPIIQEWTAKEGALHLRRLSAHPGSQAL